MKLYKNILLLLSTLFLVPELVAQEAGTSWGLQVFPNYSYRKLLPVNNSITQATLFEIGEMEQGKFSYSGGVIMEFHWGPKVGFQTGLNYQQTGYQTIRTPFILNDGTEAEQQQTFEYLSAEIPFILNFYQEFSPKTRIYFMMGGTAVANLRNQAKTTIYNGAESIGQTSTTKIEAENNPVVFSLFMGMGLEQFVSDRISIFLQPNFQFFLQPVIDDSQLARVPYGVGVSAGIKLRPFVN